jgi:hypothetical protein
VQMKTRVAGVLAATASAVALIGAPAFASDGHVTDVGPAILSGNDIYIPIAIPIDVSGIAISLLGTASAFSEGGAAVVYGSPFGSW